MPHIPRGSNCLLTGLYLHGYLGSGLEGPYREGELGGEAELVSPFISDEGTMTLLALWPSWHYGGVPTKKAHFSSELVSWSSWPDLLWRRRSHVDHLLVEIANAGLDAILESLHRETFESRK